MNEARAVLSGQNVAQGLYFLAIKVSANIRGGSLAERGRRMRVG